VALLTPTAVAIVRVNQWVAFGGFCCVVFANDFRFVLRPHRGCATAARRVFFDAGEPLVGETIPARDRPIKMETGFWGK